MIKTVEDYKYLYEERAGIIEYDGRSSKMAAENRAWDEIKKLYMKDNKLSADSKEIGLLRTVIKRKSPDKSI